MSAVPLIKVMYTCHGCGLIDQPIEVEERREGEGPVQFVERVGCVAGADHRKHSPLCRSGLVDLKIPLSKEENAPLGKAPRH